MRRHPVVFIVPSFAGGGAERVMVTFANQLPLERFDPHVVLYSLDGPLRATLADHVQVHNLARSRMRQILPQLVSHIRRLRPVAVLVSTPTTNVALLAVRLLLPRGTRVVVREPNLPSLRLPSMPRGRLIALGYRFMYPRADLVLATSERMRRELVDRGSSPSKVTVLPNPVDVRRVRALADPSSRTPGPGRRLVAVGRLVPQKGYEDLLRVITTLDERDQLVVLGDGPDRARLEQLVDQLGVGARVSLLGFVDNPWAWMAGADALVLPSRTEGMPNVALEALACGTPVIATPESGGIAELAEQAPDGAVTVAPIDRFPEALATVRCRDGDLKANLLPERYHVHSAVSSLVGALLPEQEGDLR